MVATRAGEDPLQQSIDCSAQPLDLSFHPNSEFVLAAALADGTIESEYKNTVR